MVVDPVVFAEATVTVVAAVVCAAVLPNTPAVRRWRMRRWVRRQRAAAIDLSNQPGKVDECDHGTHGRAQAR